MKYILATLCLFISSTTYSLTEDNKNVASTDASQLSSAELEALLKQAKIKEEEERQNAVSKAQATLRENSTSAEGIKNWGFGFGLGVEQFRQEYIENASLQGSTKIVTTEKTYETLPSAWLTLNWNLIGLDSKKGTDFEGNDVHNVKFGFYAGVKLLGSGTSDTFSAFSLGPQVSFVTNDKVISIGAGWVTHLTKGFASGILDGQPLPSQYQEIVFKEATENSYMVMMSVGF